MTKRKKINGMIDQCWAILDKAGASGDGCISEPQDGRTEVCCMSVCMQRKVPRVHSTSPIPYLSYSRSQATPRFYLHPWNETNEGIPFLTVVIISSSIQIFHGTRSGLALFPGPAQLSSLSVRKSGRGPGIFSHMSDVKLESMVERV